MATLAAAAAFALNPSGGWPISGTALVTLFDGAVQLLCLGVLGEYVNRIYDEVRDRSRWLVQQTIGFEAAQVRESLGRRKAG